MKGDGQTFKLNIKTVRGSPPPLKPNPRGVRPAPTYAAIKFSAPSAAPSIRVPWAQADQLVLPPPPPPGLLQADQADTPESTYQATFDTSPEGDWTTVLLPWHNVGGGAPTCCWRACRASCTPPPPPLWACCLLVKSCYCSPPSSGQHPTSQHPPAAPGSPQFVPVKRAQSDPYGAPLDATSISKLGLVLSRFEFNKMPNPAYKAGEWGGRGGGGTLLGAGGYRGAQAAGGGGGGASCCGGQGGRKDPSGGRAWTLVWTASG